MTVAELNGMRYTYNAITRKILLCRRDLMLLVFLKVVSSSGLLPHTMPTDM